MKMRRVVLVVVMAAAANASAATAPATGGGKPLVIGAPHYGDTLFNFYQEKTFDALLGLMVSQHFMRLAPHDDEAEVLRGGMLLAYGMHNEAASVFARLLDGTTAPAVRDRAWYFLARAQHRRGLLDEAQAALSRIQAPLQGRAAVGSEGDGSLEDNRQLLQAQLLLAREDYAAAASVLQTLKDNSQVGLVARFNLGVALIKNGEREQGQALLDLVGQAPAANEEQRSVRDRANLALGIAALQTQQPRQARLNLQRVRLQGLEAKRALLAFGWAAMALNDPQLALVPWQELAAKPDVDGAVLEARLAVPYALAEIGATQRALDAYAAAADSFAQEQQALSASVAALSAGRSLQDLVAKNPSEGLGALADIQALPDMPSAAYLTPLLAGNDFQQTFKNLHDLQFLQGKLLQWQDSLGSFAQMLENRHVAFEQRLPAVRARAGAAAGPAALQLRSQALATELAAAQADNKAVVFADPREAALLQRLQRAQAGLARLGAEPGLADAAKLAEASDRLRLLSGALTWQLTQALPQRRWNATKGLRDADIALAQAQVRDAALTAAQLEEPARQQAFAARLAELTQRLNRLLPALTQEAQAHQRQLAALAVVALQNQQQLLTVYEGQARLATAQLQDQAQFTRPQDGERQRPDSPVQVPAQVPR
jgi:hypothetical protein